MKWRNIIRCKRCDAVSDTPHRLGLLMAEDLNLAGGRFLLCRSCGCMHGWYDSIEAWISEAVWWNPLTWGKGHWLKKSA